MAFYDAVIVGSGPNGLTAAAFLARRGLSTLVLEAAETPGGGARSAELTLPGFTHDFCAGVFPLAAASPAFQSLDLGRFGLEWVEPDAPLAHPLDDGTAALLERDVEATAAALGPDQEAWLSLLSREAAAWPALRVDLLGPPLKLPRRPLSLAAFGWKAIQPAYRLACRRFRTEAARALFAGLAAHSVLPLERLGSAAVGLVLAIAGHSVGWPLARGGAGSITAALLAAIRRYGGEIESGRQVASLAELPPARAVLLDVSPSQAARIAKDRLPPWVRRRLERFRHAPGAFKLDWALEGPIPWQSSRCRRAGTVHIGGGLEAIAAAERDAWEGRVPEQPFVLLAQPSLFDPSRAPAGRHTAWGYCHVPRGSPVDMTEQIERQVERFAPGFRDRILARSRLGPAELERHNANLVGGDLTGGALLLGQLLFRPYPSRDPYRLAENIYLCSSSTPPGGGVHGMCGFHAARSAARNTFGDKALA